MFVQLAGADILTAFLERFRDEKNTVHIILSSKALLQRKVRSSFTEGFVKLQGLVGLGIEKAVEDQLGLGEQIIRFTSQILPVVEFGLGKMYGKGAVVRFSFLRIDQCFVCGQQIPHFLIGMLSIVDFQIWMQLFGSSAEGALNFICRTGWIETQNFVVVNQLESINLP